MASSVPGSENGNLLNGQTLLDGFGFLEGQLIGNAPLVFPGESDVFMLLELTAQFGGSFGPIGAVVALIAEIITMILELVDYLVSLFEGVPRTQKSLIVAHRFANGQSVVGHLVSSQLYQLINDEGIVLSSSNPSDQAKLGEIRTQAELLLVTLGATQADAKKAITDVFDNTTGPDEALPGLLKQPMPTGWVLVGPQKLQADYIFHYNKYVGQGLNPTQAAKLTWKWIYQHEQQKLLVQIRFRPQPGTHPCPPGQSYNPMTGLCESSQNIGPQCPPGQVFNPQTQRCEYIVPPTCPEGQQFDPTTQMCVPIPPPPPPAPCVPTSDGTEDELTDGLNCVSQNLNVIQNQIAQLQLAITGQGGQPLDPVTCTQLGTYVSTLNVSLNSIVAAIAAAAGNAGAGGGTQPTPVVNVTVEPAPVVIEPGTTPPCDVSFLKLLVERQPDLDAQMNELNKYFVTLGADPQFLQIAGPTNE